MVLCKRGKLVDGERINKYEKMCHYMVRKHFPSMNFPGGMCYEDLVNDCRYEVFIAIQKVDPEKALTSTMKDPKKQKAKEIAKRASPEAALDQAEINIVYYRLDFLLKGLKWKHGIKTASGKRQGKTVSLEHLMTNRQEAINDIMSTSVDVDKILHEALPEKVRNNLDSCIDMLLWIMKRKTAKEAKAYLHRLPTETQQGVRERLLYRIEQDSCRQETVFTHFTQEDTDSFDSSIFVS